MKHRITEILASESIATAATKVVDINISKPISKIGIRVKGTNASSTPTAHPANIVTKMELVDGSDVLFSMSGIDCQALNFYENGELPFNINEYEDNIQVCAVFGLNFGRFLWDKQLALDPKRFSNLQLKITHNKAAGGSAPDAGTLEIVAYVFEDEAVTPGGFLMSKETYTYTLTASAHEYIDMPTDYAYRMLLVKSYSTSLAPSSNYNKIKLTMDNDRQIYINNISTSELLKHLQPGDMVEENFAGLGSGSAVAYFLASTYENYGVGVGRSAAGAGIIVAQPSGGGINITNDSSESFAVHATGYAPFGALNILMHDKDIMADFFDPKLYQSVQLDLTAGSSASGTVEIILQQLRTY